MSSKTDNQTSSDSNGGQCKFEKSICPMCNRIGAVVKTITPRHTLKTAYRHEVDQGGHYHFCATPACAVVYFDCVSGTLFKQEHLINRVTVKDNHPKTPLCYCFKVLKEDALQELSETGTTDVVAMIRERMKKHGCQCVKLNPRGGCCLKDIDTWLSSL